MKETRYVLGVMSGTSLDGVDLCYTGFKKIDDGYSFKILHAETVPYPHAMLERLHFRQLSAEKLLALDHDYGSFLGAAISDFLERNNISGSALDTISSHGHTYYHKPTEGYTFQIGNGPEIFAKTGIKTICDFRRQDVALGGQGAPLVPIGDELLFSDYDACLNLGGFANISFRKNETRIASDICAVNFVLNHFSRKLNKPYDQGGKIAASGETNEALLEELNRLPFFQKKPPKSLGAEWVHENLLPLLEKAKLGPKDIIATFSAHAAYQIAEVLKNNNLGNCLVTGGGAYNVHLLNQIQKFCNTQLIVPEPKIVEFKEALIFALMGLLRDEGKVNILKSVTGSTADHSSGIIYH